MIVDLLHKMKRRIEKTEADARKFGEGNTSAGIRVRKQMQKIRKESKFIRYKIQEIREERLKKNG